MRHTRKPRIGIIGMGHFIYWPQFDGLKEELMQKQKDFRKYFSEGSDLIDIGFADDIDSSFECLKRAQIFASLKIAYNGASLGFASEEEIEGWYKKIYV